MKSVIVLVFLLFQCVDRHICTEEQSDTRITCPPNFYQIRDKQRCHLYLTCDNMNDMKIVKRLGTGAVKDVYLVDWEGIFLVMSVPANLKYLKDFMHNVEMLQLLRSYDYVVKFLGFCKEKYALFTEYHCNGNAANFFSKNSTQNYSVLESLEFCLQYSLILNHLHNGEAGRRVFCDSNTLFKLLSQLLVTSDLRLVLNDVDALPQVLNNSDVKCGHQRVTGTFVAPEQLWIRGDEFDDDLMPGYNEKTDIWKAAIVCDFFLKQSVGTEVVRYRLFDLHSKCKSKNPAERPTSEDLVKEYSRVINEFKYHSEL